MVIQMIEVVLSSCFLFAELNHTFGALLFFIELINVYILQ